VGGEWWAEGDDEGARAAQGQGAGSAQGRQGRAERAACARGGRGRVGAREVMRSPWVWGRGAPLRLPGPPWFRAVNATVRVRCAWKSSRAPTTEFEGHQKR
jgi:hypothetical protein